MLNMWILTYCDNDEISPLSTIWIWYV